MSEFRHLSIDKRLTIEQMLKDRCLFKVIAKEINKHCTTISKEIKNHMIFKQTGYYGRGFNNCQHRFTCQNISICGLKHCDYKYCKSRSICTKVCKKQS